MPATLNEIRIKVRRLTRSPSTSQITDAEINEYVNTFVLYDFPEQLRLFTFRTVLTFYLRPHVDVYATNTTDNQDPLFDFKDRFITIHDPIYIDGFQVGFTQDRTEFFSWYSFTSSIRQEATGDAVATVFTFTLTDIPVLQRHVLLTSIDINGIGMSIRDEPITDILGDLVNTNTGAINGTINYVTGVVTNLTFPVAPRLSEPINSHTVPYVTSRSTAVLYYNNEFTVRPVPDQPYEIKMDAYIRPTALLEAGDEPALEQMWQYIAYGAAKKILEDRTDLETVQLLMPEFKQQERLVLRRTLVQYSNDRVATIYTSQTEFSSNPWDFSQFL